MDILKLVLGIALIAGYMALRLGWTYKRDTKQRKQSFWDRIESVLLLVLGVVMLAGGMYLILLSFA